MRNCAGRGLRSTAALPAGSRPPLWACPIHAHHYGESLSLGRAAGSDVTALEQPARIAFRAAGDHAVNRSSAQPAASVAPCGSAFLSAVANASSTWPRDTSSGEEFFSAFR